MFKVRVLSKCLRCNGEAYLPIEECEDSQGRTYTRHTPCPTCEGSGNQSQLVDLQDFYKMLLQAQCPHDHTSYQGSMRFSAGDVWDDIQEVCDDCGASRSRLRSHPIVFLSLPFSLVDTSSPFVNIFPSLINIHRSCFGHR